MQQLANTTAPPRFTLADIQGWTKKELRALSISNQFIKKDEKITLFREARKITEMLRPLELAMVSDAIAKVDQKEITSVADVHGYYLGSQDCYYSKEGLNHFVPQKVGPPKKEVIPPAQWVAPKELLASHPGIQWMVGIAITCLQRDEGCIVPFTVDKPYTMLNFTGLTSSQLKTFSHILAAVLNPFFKGKRNTGNGRQFIVELFSAIGALPLQDYVALHWGLAMGPFNTCFKWSVLTQKSKKKFIATPTARMWDNRVYILESILPEYQKSFIDIAQFPSGQQCIPALEEVNKMKKTITCIPIWVAGIKITADISEGRDMWHAHKYMTMCREQRQTDEKGLSAWSGGYGASGNPTKAQLRLQKKLSIITGILSGMTEQENLLILDDKTSEISVLDAQLQMWSIHVADLGKKNYTFYVPSSETAAHVALGSRASLSPIGTPGNRRLYFPDGAPTVPKEKEWAKLDLEQCLKIKTMLGIYSTAKMRAETKTLIYIYTSVMSSLLFADWSVITLGSAHNMMALLTNDSEFHFGESNGESLWHFGRSKGLTLTKESYVQRVMNHNAARSGFFLNGSYQFSPRLNFLRRIPGKTINFVTGEVDDVIGIEIQADTVPDDYGGVAETEDAGYEFDPEASDSSDDEDTEEDEDSDGEPEIATEQQIVSTREETVDSRLARPKKARKSGSNSSSSKIISPPPAEPPFCAQDPFAAST